MISNLLLDMFSLRLEVDPSKEWSSSHLNILGETPGKYMHVHCEWISRLHLCVYIFLFIFELVFSVFHWKTTEIFPVYPFPSFVFEILPVMCGVGWRISFSSLLKILCETVYLLQVCMWEVNLIARAVSETSGHTWSRSAIWIVLILVTSRLTPPLSMTPDLLRRCQQPSACPLSHSNLLKGFPITTANSSKTRQIQSKQKIISSGKFFISTQLGWSLLVFL